MLRGPTANGDTAKNFIQFKLFLFLLGYRPIAGYEGQPWKILCDSVTSWVTLLEEKVSHFG